MSGLSQPQGWALGYSTKESSLRLHQRWCVHSQGSRDLCEETSISLTLSPLKTVVFAYFQGGGTLAFGDNCVCVCVCGGDGTGRSSTVMFIYFFN